jgi:uncharacterized membrane protein
MTPDTLRQVPLFESLHDDAAQRLCDLLEAVEAKESQTLFRAGDAGNAMYLIESGEIRISIKAEDGNEITVAELGPGEFFGEMSILDGQARAANATAMGPSRLGMLSRRHFLSFMQANSDVALGMLTALANRLRSTNELLQRRVARNVNEEDQRTLTFADRAADVIAEFGGSWRFIFASLALFCFWVATNTVLLSRKPFDPFPFILLNLALNVITALQAPIIMMSQNRQSHKDRIRADLDYKLNLKNELALNEILQRLHLLEHERARLASERSAAASH